jgi:hypothetical protein
LFSNPWKGAFHVINIWNKRIDTGLTTSEFHRIDNTKINHDNTSIKLKGKKAYPNSKFPA